MAMEKSTSQQRIQQVFEALEAAYIPASSRKNVRETGDKSEIKGMCLGVTNLWHVGPIVSKATKENRRLSILLTEFAKAELPGFTFTSVQVNKDYRAALHVDGNNHAESWIIGLGKYTGGELWMHDGSRFGRGESIKNRWLRFDGNDPHCVMPFRGRRYSLVYFTYCHPNSKSLSSLGRTWLTDLGFPLPDDADINKIRGDAGEKEKLLEVAVKSLSRFVQRATVHGGIGRVVIKVCLPDRSEVKAAIAPTTPLGFLTEIAGKRFATQNSKAGSELEIPRTILRFGSLDILPNDTIQGLGLESYSVLDVHVIENAPAKGEPRTSDNNEDCPSNSETVDAGIDAVADDCSGNVDNLGNDRTCKKTAKNVLSMRRIVDGIGRCAKRRRTVDGAAGGFA